MAPAPLLLQIMKTHLKAKTIILFTFLVSLIFQITYAGSVEIGLKDISKDNKKYPKYVFDWVQEGTVVDGWVYTNQNWIAPHADFWMVNRLFDEQTIDDRLTNNKLISLIHHKRVNTDFATIRTEGEFTFIHYPADLYRKSPLFLAEVFYKDCFLRTIRLCGSYEVSNTSPKVPDTIISLFPMEEYKQVAMKLLRAYKGEITLPVDREYAQRQKKRMEEIKRDREERDPRYADRKWHEYLMFSVGNEIAEKGLIPRERIPGEKAVIPNVNEGLYLQTRCTDRLAKLLEKASGCQVGAISGDGAKPIRGSMTFHLGDYEDERYVYMWVAHAYSYYQAGRCMYTMTSFLDNGPLPRTGQGKDGKMHILTPDELLALLEPAGDAVGEQCMRLRATVDDEGLPVKGSEKRSIYFTRGNTAVALFTDEPDINVLPLARAIDKLLVEGMRKAGEPLTKEQDYLKEDAEKK